MRRVSVCSRCGKEFDSFSKHSSVCPKCMSDCFQIINSGAELKTKERSSMDKVNLSRSKKQDAKQNKSNGNSKPKSKSKHFEYSRICYRCGKTYITTEKHSIYCSDSCKNVENGLNKDKKLNIEIEDYEDIIKPIKNNLEILNENENENEDGFYILKCKFCNKNYSTDNNRQKFCSEGCFFNYLYREREKAKVSCEVCDKRFRPKKIEDTCCSLNCYNELEINKNIKKLRLIYMLTILVYNVDI
jgi:hypothetical protein